MVSSRMWLRILVLGVSFIIVAGISVGVEKPNIVLILADDLSWHDAGCYGNSDVRTPHIDQLAKEGMLFTQAFTATAMCAPSRQQLYTGVFPVRNGGYLNHTDVKKGTRSLGHHLTELGYSVGLRGKRHFGPPSSFPFRRFTIASAEEPFCFVYASSYPHLSWPEAKDCSPQSLTVPPYLVDTPETRTALCRYYTEVNLFDNEVGELLRELEESGRANRTIVILTSEQGSAFPGCKWTCYDGGLRTQFIVRWPGVVKPGSRTDALIQYVDVVPTLIELAGGDPCKSNTGLAGGPAGGMGFDGRSFLQVLLGKTDSHNDFVFAVQTIKGAKPYGIRAIRDARYKYIWNLLPGDEVQVAINQRDNIGCWQSWIRKAKVDKAAAILVERYRSRPPDELYNILNDPYELDNLADNPQLQETLAAMKKRLEVWMVQQGDSGYW